MFPATVVIASTRTAGERSAMIKATASSEAVSVSIRKSGFTPRRIANSARGRARKQFGLMPQSSRKSPHAERYRKSDTEDVYDHADDHQLQGKRTLGRSGERQHNAIHQEIDGHAIENARSNRMLYQRTNSAARDKVDRSCTKCDEEVTKKA